MTADVVEVSTNNTLIVQFDSVGHRSTKVSNLTEQPFRVRMLWAEVTHKH